MLCIMISSDTMYNKQTRTHARTHTYTHTRMHARKHTSLVARDNTRARARTHTHNTHTHRLAFHQSTQRHAAVRPKACGGVAMGGGALCSARNPPRWGPLALGWRCCAAAGWRWQQRPPRDGSVEEYSDTKTCIKLPVRHVCQQVVRRHTDSSHLNHIDKTY